MASGKKTISVAEKQKIIQSIEGGEKQSSICARLNLAKSTVNTIWKRREDFKRKLDHEDVSADCKRVRFSTHHQLDKALLNWFKQARDNNTPVTGPILITKTKSLAQSLGDESFVPTTGFIDRWKTRHGICQKSIAGEAGSVSEESVKPWLETHLPELLAQFKPEDIYNADETGLFYKLQLDKSLNFEGEKCTGGKKAKERLTVLVCGSMAGEKLPLLVTGRSKSPRCFAGVKNLPVAYEANAKAWMTGDLFRKWLQTWNNKLVLKSRNVLLIVDNCPAHPKDVDLTNITVKFLPPNTTAKLQPCDQGIIQCLKVHYRHQLLMKTVTAMDSGKDLKITVLDAMQWMKVAWDKVTPTTVANCFRHCSFKIATSDVPEASHPEPPSIDNVMVELQQRGVEADVSGSDFATVDDDVATSGTLSDADIVAMVQGTDVVDGEDDDHDDADASDEQIPCPSVAEYRTALDTVRRFAICKSSNTAATANALDSLEKLLFDCSTLKQSSITDVFK